MKMSNSIETAVIQFVVAGVFLFEGTLASADGRATRPQKQVVILYTHRTLTPINADWDRGIRSALAAEFDEPVDVEIEYLNLVRHRDAEYVRSWIELLKTKYATRPPDVVIPVYVPALQFTIENREVLFPKTPIVFCSAPPLMAQRAHALPHVTGVAFRLDYSGTLSAAMKSHPNRKRLILLSGISAPERAATQAAQEAMKSLNTGLEIETWEGLPVGLLIQKLQADEEKTIALMLTYDEDSDGNHYSTVEVTEQLASKCSVPIYGLYDTLLGHGIVGGSLGSAESQGELAGRQAVRVLKGESPEQIAIEGLTPATYKFDARQLDRWQLQESHLPPGSLVLFRSTTFWGQYGHYVLLSVVAFLLQSAIIVALLVNRSRRVQAEQEARDLAGKILTAQEDERRFLAREMHDDLSQRLAASAIEAGNLEQLVRGSPESMSAVGGLKEHLVTLCDDVHRLSRRIHSSILDDFGLADAIRSECVRFEERNGTPVEFRCGDLPSNIPYDVTLCLYRIAQESLWNTTKYACTDRVLVELNADPEFLHLELQDFGRGFDTTLASNHQGLGLASMSERARLVRGKIEIASFPGQGVTVSVQIPLPEDLE